MPAAISKGIRENIFAILLFFIFLAVGLCIYRDYGVPWDEPTQRSIGYANIDFILQHDNRLLDMKDRFYGPTYEIFLIGAEKVVQPSSTRNIYFLRHLLVFLTFFIGTVFFYILAANLFKQKTTALLSTIALVLSPRLFDNAFYNSKDIPLLVFFVICFTLLFFYLETKRRWLLICMAFFSAITTTIRIAGIMIPFLAVTAILVNANSNFPPGGVQRIRLSASTIGWFLLLYSSFTLLFWPILWSNPITNFAQAMQGMSHFQWVYTVLFMGMRYEGSEIPAIYPVVWILITTPVFYTILFLTGIVIWIAEKNHASGKLLEKDSLKWLFVAAWFFIPLLLVILLKSTLYDSWRHLFFIYPAFLLLAFWGLERSLFYLNNRFVRLNWRCAAIYAILIVTFFFTARFMITAHPYQQLYFNIFAGRRLSEIQEKYDLDYWGLAYRSGLEYISQHDQSQAIVYVSETLPGTYTFILPEEDRARLIATGNEADAKYLITNYRFQKTYPPYPEIFSVEVEGAKILSVFELR